MSVRILHPEPWRFPPRRREQPSLIKCVLLITFFILGVCSVLLLFRSSANRTTEILNKRSSSQETYEFDRLSKGQCQEVCTTKDCIKTASGIINRMDTSIDPCKDFYRFSCGKYDKVPMEKGKREQFMTEAEEEVAHVVRGIIESIPKHLPKNTPGHSSSNARNLYDSCMSFRSTEENAIPTAMKYLEYFGVKNWPNINSHYEFINPDLDDVLERLFLFAANPVFFISVDQNKDTPTEMNSTEHIDSNSLLKIKVTPSRRALFLTHISGKDKFVNGMMQILEYFGMPEETSSVIVQDVFAFDNALSHIKEVSFKRTTTCFLNSSISCSAYRFDCNYERNSEIEQWCRLANKAISGMGMAKRYSQFHIIIEDRFYFEDVRMLINRTSQRTIAYGLALQFFIENSMAMNYRFRKISVLPVYRKELMDKLIEDRSLMCTYWVLMQMPALVGSAFYTRKYKGQLQSEGDDIFEDIRKSIISLAKNMTWMDPTAQESLEKTMESVVITLNYYYKHISNASGLDEFYETLDIKDDNFLHNAMELRRSSVALNYLYADEASASMKLAFQRNPFHLNPHYDFDNIFIDFSSFIYPLISQDRPRYSNLGIFGYFLAHEYSHGVEIFLRNPKNMSSNFENALRDKKECLIDHYSQYEIERIQKQVNGSATLNENMADFFAIRATYEALKKYEKENGVDKTLPGLNYNVKQLFFISVAQFLCESESNSIEAFKEYLNDRHSPNKIRILGVMKNFPPFSEVFNCHPGSPMHPSEKCNF